MNSIITSAVLGVIMMFSGIFLKKNSSIAALATLSALLLLVMDILDMAGYHFFPVDTHNMLYFDVFGLLFNAIAFGSTLIYFLLNGRDIASIGNNPGEYFALMFFVLCGISIASSFIYDRWSDAAATVIGSEAPRSRQPHYARRRCRLRISAWRY